MQDNLTNKASPTIESSVNPSVIAECRPALDLERTRKQLCLGDDFIHTLLEDFNTKYETFEETLREHLACGDYKEARVFIHTLAGLAGTIAADEHHQQAKILEASLLDSEADIDISPIVETHNRLRRHISAITDKMRDMKDLAPPSNDTGNP